MAQEMSSCLRRPLKTSAPRPLETDQYASGIPNRITPPSPDHKGASKNKNITDLGACDPAEASPNPQLFQRYPQKPDIPRRRDDAALGARLRVSKLENSKRSWRRTSSVSAV
jgi:hypothetical protein